MRHLFTNRTALIIGGSGGIGQAVAYELAKAGATLIIHGGHSEARLASTLKQIQNIQAKAGIPADNHTHRSILQPLATMESLQFILKQVPKIDILVYSFGPFIRKPLHQVTVDEWNFMANMNLAFPGALVSAYLEPMLEQKWGRIILFGGTNTDSIRGFLTTTAYAAAKTGLGVLAKSVARQGGPSNVTCNVICPGMVDTEYLDDTVRSYAQSKAPGGILISREKIATFIMDIMKSEHTNGSIISVDRGLVI